LLAETDLDVHVHGAKAGDCASIDLEVTEHTGTDRAYRDAWFVVFVPAERAPDAEGGTLACLEIEPRTWGGFWTTDEERVGRIADYVAREL